MKAISVRLNDKLGKELDDLCERIGYKKNTVISRLVEAYVRSQTGHSVRRSGRKTEDPFASAIGLLNLKPLLISEEEIDRVVYNV